jgi:hypothetical protein
MYRAYHDEERGVPVADTIRLFEKPGVEAFQAGLRDRSEHQLPQAQLEFQVRRPSLEICAAASS